jgi:hypothetical protein
MTSSSYQIIVRNLSQATQYFYVFQKQATFQPLVSSGSILCSSLGCQNAANYGNSGAQIVFGLDRQIYAGAVSTMAPVPPSQLVVLISLPASQPLVSSTTAVRPISLTTATPGSAPNCTVLTLNPLALSVPANQSGIPVGAFAMNVPSYTPTPLPELYCGVAALNGDGVNILSSFIAPLPNSTLSCAPEQIFFVKTGYQAVGSVMTYDESNSARCDFSTGFTTITVTYNSDGTFSTKGGS